MTDHSEDNPQADEMQSHTTDDANVPGIPELTPDPDKAVGNTDDLDISMEDLGDLQDLIANESNEDESTDALANILDEDVPADIHDFIEDAVEQMGVDETDTSASDMPDTQNETPSTDADTGSEVQTLDEALGDTLEDADEAAPELTDANADALEELPELIADENDNAESDAAPEEDMPDASSSEIDDIVAQMEGEHPDASATNIPDVEEETPPGDTEIGEEAPQTVDETSEAVLETAEEPPMPETDKTDADMDISDTSTDADALEGLQDIIEDIDDGTNTDIAPDNTQEEATDNIRDDIEAAVDEMESYIGRSSDADTASSELEKAVELTTSDVHNIVGDDVDESDSDATAAGDTSTDATTDEASTGEKRLELTEDDYADADKTPDDMPGLDDVEQATAPDIESDQEDVPDAPTPSDNTTDSAMSASIIPAASNAAHTTTKEPKMPIKNKTKTVKESAPSSIFPTLVGLLGIIIAAGALWLALDINKKQNQLKANLAAMQNHIAATTPNKGIPALIRHMNAEMNQLDARTYKLNEQLTAHLRMVAQARAARIKAATPAPETKKLLPPPITTTKPVVTAVAPTAARKHKPWVINLTSFKHAGEAKKNLAYLKKLGIHAETFKVKTHGTTWYRVRIPGFNSVKEAETQRRALIKRLGIKDTWIGKF